MVTRKTNAARAYDVEARKLGRKVNFAVGEGEADDRWWHGEWQQAGRTVLKASECQGAKKVERVRGARPRQAHMQAIVLT